MSRVERSSKARWLEWTLNALTIGAVVAALYLVVTERVLPAVRRATEPVMEGERLPEPLSFERLGAAGDEGPSEGVVRAPGELPTILLVFDTSCPACYRNLPAWRELIDAGRGEALALAVGLDGDTSRTRTYARRHLAGTLAVRPADRRGLLETLGIAIVPFTAIVAPDGGLEFVHHGTLDSEAVRTGVRALEALTGLSNR